MFYLIYTTKKKIILVLMASSSLPVLVQASFLHGTDIYELVVVPDVSQSLYQVGIDKNNMPHLL